MKNYKLTVRNYRKRAVLTYFENELKTQVDK